MSVIEIGNNRLKIEQRQAGHYYFVTEVFDGATWRAGTRAPSYPVNSLVPHEAGRDYLAGSGDRYSWLTTITTLQGGFFLETVLHVKETVELNPAMILWLDALDNLNDRQAHTWRQTILRAPTVNQQGLPGNDLPAGYIYDHATQTETICYFPPDCFAWIPSRFYNFTVREVMVYRPQARYGFGLLPNSPEINVALEPGEHRLAWWFTQRHRPDVPTPWEAQRTLVEGVAPLIDPEPSALPNTISWQEVAERTLADLDQAACWVSVREHEGLRAYVRGSSAVGRDEAPGFELMTQLDVLWPLMVWREVTGNVQADAAIERLKRTLPSFYRPAFNFVANNFSPHSGDSFMDTWYFLENALIKLPWVAYLSGDKTLREMFFSAVEGAKTLAHNANYLFPLFADAEDWQPRHSLLNVGVAGLYAAGCVLAYQLGGEDAEYLHEAARALQTMYQLPPHLLTHEPQQLSFAAASARYLARTGYSSPAMWRQMAADFVYLTLRMGYWARDPAVPFYDPRGMFQACASLCYPAYKENIEVLVAWPELLRDGIGAAALMAAFANLQRRHNYAFFDPWLPKAYRRGPCAYIPYEDLATAEFTHTANLGKELYGAGEVFWSALLFDALGQVDDPHILCLCLDVPCLELDSFLPAGRRRYLVYNPLAEPRRFRLSGGDGDHVFTLDPQSVQVIVQ